LPQQSVADKIQPDVAGGGFKLDIDTLVMHNKTVLIHKIGDILVDSFHYLALFSIGAMIVWSAVHEYIMMMKSGYANLEDILLF